MLVASPSLAQTKVADQGISATEIVIGNHTDMSGPVKVWGVPFSNGMKTAVDGINAAGGIHGRRIRLIIEDSGYDPKKAVLATQKLIERDQAFSNVKSAPLGPRLAGTTLNMWLALGQLKFIALWARSGPVSRSGLARTDRLECEAGRSFCGLSGIGIDKTPFHAMILVRAQSQNCARPWQSSINLNASGFSAAV